MKYDVLEPFKSELERTLSPNTAKKYYSAVKNIFSDLQFSNLSEIDPDIIEKKLEEIKGKNQFSATKNGLLRLKKFDDRLILPGEDYFKNLSRHKRNFRKNKGKVVPVDTVKRKINQISNEKLKLAYRLALATGVRVSELEKLRPMDITIKDDNKIIVYVENGKGGKSRNIEGITDKYLCNRLKDYMSEFQPNEPLFFSEDYMREKANDLGIEMHDLRRIFAVEKKSEAKREGMSVYEANGIVQKNLGHASFRVTRRYLYGKKIVHKKGKVNGKTNRKTT